MAYDPLLYPTIYRANKKTLDDIPKLIANNAWETLNNFVICQEKAGKVTAVFGDDRWEVAPFISGRKNYKSAFDFKEFHASPPLMLELKLITYGWMYFKAHRSNVAVKPISLICRLSKLKVAYRFLLENKYESISALSCSETWKSFISHTVDLNLSQASISQVFGAINSVIRLQSWLQYDFNLKMIRSKELARKLSNNGTQQTLTIPEKLADQIYGRAIELITDAYSFCDELAKLNDELQESYLTGKAEVEKRIKNGQISYLTNSQGTITNKQEFANRVNSYQKDKSKGLLFNYNRCVPKSLQVLDVIEFRRLYGQVITACYICCGAFSGMRDSELGELSPDSYYVEVIEGREFHLLQSKTFKFGEKAETWVAAPVVAKAIEVASQLTERWRSEYSKSTNQPFNRLWLNQIHRSKSPVVICDWNERLRRFCMHFGIVVTKEDFNECITSNPHSQTRVKNTIKVNSPWPLTSHQFRRTFAFYAIKHRLGTTQVLKQQFKHLYLQMSRWYSNGARAASLSNLQIDNELQKLLETSKYEETANKFFDMINSDTPLSGTHGKAIMQMREDLPYIYSSWDVIYDAVKKGTLTLHGTMHSYCKNGYDCDMDGVVNPAFCVDCKSGGSIIDEPQAKNWQDKHSQLTSYLKNQKDISPSVYAHCITQIRAAESVMLDFNIHYEQYKHPVEVTQYE